MGLRRKDESVKGEEDRRIIDFGHPELHPPFADNSIQTSKYTLLSFFPYAIRGQFRRNGNIYFLCIGLLMIVGYYSQLFYSAILPWTTLGPLAFVVSISLIQEAYTDAQRHRSDNETNNHPCVVLRRADEMNKQPVRGKKKSRKRDPRLNQGNDLKVKVLRNEEAAIAFESVKRMNISTGDLVFVHNREMVPADLILLASANEGGGAYIETSSIDGETNLKLRASPQLPTKRAGMAHDFAASNSVLFNEGGEESANLDPSSSQGKAESFAQAVERVVNMSLLGHPDGICALANPANADEPRPSLEPPALKRTPKNTLDNIWRRLFGNAKKHGNDRRRTVPAVGEHVTYIATLTSEQPNQHVNNYNGKLTLPPNVEGLRSDHAPLDADNILLRGAVLRNTEWVIGLACFTGADTKLVMNSVATPSKFSRLDGLINRTVVLVFGIMIICVCSLGAASVHVTETQFDQLWYAGLNKQEEEPWPYFNVGDAAKIESPEWKTSSQNFIQNTLMFVTLLSNFIPLSLYVSVEIITAMMMLFVNWDIHMYHEDSDTPAAARSTIVTDLGLVEYIFSDKTGTLTCNIMEFKRCSVDGHAFGTPVVKAAPQTGISELHPNELEILPDSAQPLKHLLAASGTVLSTVPNTDGSIPSLDVVDEADESAVTSARGRTETLTFNAEMFLRVMSLCHTVVVEKDNIVPSYDQAVHASSKKKKKFTIKSPRARSGSQDSNVSKGSRMPPEKAKNKNDGAPEGFAYQAESPDEGALVSAASLEYGFQLVGRNSSGVQISVPCPSLLEDDDIVKRLKNGSMTAKMLATKTAPIPGASSKYHGLQVKTVDEGVTPHTETWPILAINKFDSDRKRMSVLVRSPPELGSVFMLLCKGADSSMLTKEVCQGVGMLDSIVDRNGPPKANPESEADKLELDTLLGISAHLGEFATEGLRTLVLGVKILSDEDADRWLSKFKEASTLLENREMELTNVANEIERDLHIVGATAIEDKLQDGVPETIANLGKAGIKLWVLTGDKRETAIEIGYSTRVLSPKMHLTEVVDGPGQDVKALVAMELMRHIKIGNLPDYQRVAIEQPPAFSLKSLLNCLAIIGNWRRKTWLTWRKLYLTNIKRRWLSEDNYFNDEEDLQDEIEAETRRADPRIQRSRVREHAKEIIRYFWNDPNNAHLKVTDDLDTSIVNNVPPSVFERAKSAKQSIISRRESEEPSDLMSETAKLTSLAMAKGCLSSRDGLNEEALSMQSYRPTKETNNFDEQKRNLFERLFATDKDVRHGKLSKHLKNEYIDALTLDEKEQSGKIEIESMIGATPSRPRHKAPFDVGSIKRGLVLEGAALKHLLGDPVLEEMLFAVASCSDSVIACRVSPIQKALLLKMVRKYVSPTPTTLAIGDGANDVGMIQEAHIGIGVSGLEGQQAVNASDFAIAQFRFLESLLLIHGRWNFMRMSKAVLFFFYKNAVLIGTIMIFSEKCLHSGTPLYDPWVISVFNFVGGSMPAVLMAVFDRDLPRDYVMRHPQVYQSGPNNEFLSLRMFIRWVFITFIHAFSIYYFSAPAIQLGGGVSSAFKGLMGNRDRGVGDGEGGDLQVFGTTIYSQLVYVVTFKALYETRSIIQGEFPTFTCKRGKGEGWLNRVGYTWVGLTWFSILFYYFFLYTYQLMGREGPHMGSFFPMVFVTSHLFNMRSITWMVSILVPAICVIFDVTGKITGNMFFPTQTQIHSEIAAREQA